MPPDNQIELMGGKTINPQAIVDYAQYIVDTFGATECPNAVAFIKRNKTTLPNPVPEVAPALAPVPAPGRGRGRGTKAAPAPEPVPAPVPAPGRGGGRGTKAAPAPEPVPAPVPAPGAKESWSCLDVLRHEGGRIAPVQSLRVVLCISAELASSSSALPSSVCPWLTPYLSQEPQVQLFAPRVPRERIPLAQASPVFRA